jgi:dihydrofolate synthase/folylpolyglutamate synthase
MSTKAAAPIEVRLAAASSPAIVPGLERIHSLLRLLGRPERGLRAIHVAGSNGKGSVCRLLESALAAQGLRTGLFISPHLVDFTERYRLNTRPASRRDLEAAAKPLWEALRSQATRPEGPATYFEALTALAFLYYRLQRVDVLVLETGLGGRLDSTNVLPHPLLTIITNISLEHTQILGKTESLIAAEKAGIIKKGSPLVTAAKGRARAVILRRFRHIQGGSGARLIALQKEKDWQVLSWHDSAEHQSQTLVLRHLGDKHVLALPLLGRHQHENLACALAGLKLLTPKLNLDWGRLAYGLSQAHWPGRLQVIGRRPLTLLDGAHNPAGARVLADYVGYLEDRRRPSRRAWVVGVLKDKDWKSMFRIWASFADRVFVARPPDSRGLPAVEAVNWLRLQGIPAQAAPDLAAALKRARSWAGPQGLVMAAGSLYSAGALLKKA